MRQKRRNRPVHPDRCKASGVAAALPRQPPARHQCPRQAQLREGGENQPRPPVGLGGMAHAGGRPSERLLEEAEGMLQIEAPGVGEPEEFQIGVGPLGAVPPQPQDARRAPPLAAGQPLDLHQHQRPDDDRGGTTAAASFVRLHFWWILRPGAHAHLPVARVLAVMLGGGLGPGAWVRALHLRSVPTRPSGGCWMSAETRISVEAAPRPQADEDLRASVPKPLGALSPDHLLCRRRKEGRDPPPSRIARAVPRSVRRPPCWSPRRDGRDGRPPGHSLLPDEVEPCYELVGPPGDDGLPGGVARG